VLFVAACTDNGVGRKCIIDNNQFADAGVSTLLSSPALECPTRLCLVEAPHPGTTDPLRATCTSTCQSDQDCMDAVAGNSSDGLCSTDFVCAVATTVGASKCRTFCVCNSDLVCGFNADQNGKAITPQACGGTVQPTCP
jgi:hypothetical protein